MGAFFLLSLTGFFLLGWIRDAFYFAGVMEQTFGKDLMTYKSSFPSWVINL